MKLPSKVKIFVGKKRYDKEAPEELINKDSIAASLERAIAFEKSVHGDDKLHKDMKKRAIKNVKELQECVDALGGVKPKKKKEK